MKRLARILALLAVALWGALAGTAYRCNQDASREAAALNSELARAHSLSSVKTVLEDRGMRYSLVSDARCRQLAVDYPETCRGGPILMAEHWLQCTACTIVQGGRIEVDIRFDNSGQAPLVNVVMTPGSAWTAIRSRFAFWVTK
jgi:hypothetical protein